MISIRILFDFDDILNDLGKCWIAEINRTYGTRVKFEDVKDYGLTETFPDLTLQQLYGPYLDGRLYLDIHPVKEAQKLVEHLSATDDVCVATAGVVGVPEEILFDYYWTVHTDTNCTDHMIQFLNQYYPQIELCNIIICGRKYLIDGDVLVDDNPEHLIAFPGAKILLDKPYNREFDNESLGALRATNYDQIAHYIEMIREEKNET